ncbi:MAG: hypothetical protein ACRDJW_07790 [Thermomicrobiales bacterium]
MPFLPFRGCSCSIFLGLIVCVAIGMGGYFVGLPWVQSEVQDPIREAVETEVARQIAIAPGAAPAPGIYTVQEADLNQALAARADRYLDLNEMLAAIAPDGITVKVTVQDQIATYEGSIAAVNGRLRVIDMTADGGIRFLIPADDMATLLEDSVNNYLAANGLRLAGVDLGDGTLTLAVEPA